MAEIRWTDQAIEDLDAACDYVAHDAPRAADAVAERVTRSIARLSDFPRSGRIVPERGRDDIREIIVLRYRVIYRLRADLVEIVTIHHGTRLAHPDGSLARATLECGHHLRGEPLELLEHHLLRCPDRVTDVHLGEAGPAVLDLQERLDHSLRRPDQPGAGLDLISHRREVARSSFLGVSGCCDLVLVQAAHEPERREHLDPLLVVRRRFA